MNPPLSRTSKAKSGGWPRKVTFGRVAVTVYRRLRTDGSFGFEVANYASGKRRLESFPTEAAALDRANQLARQTSERDVVAASMTNGQAADYASAVQALAPFKVTLPDTAGTVAACLKLVGDLPNLLAAAKFYAARNKQTQRKRVWDVVAELLTVKANRKSSPRYLEDLRSRLSRFAGSFCKDACDVTTAEIQEWLDSLGLAPQSYANFRRVIHLFFEFAVARGYAADNPAAAVESIKVRGGDVAIFAPKEIAKLLAATSAEFLPALAIGAFAGLRSAEIERLEWRDIDLARRCIVIGSAKSKTASRRVVPVTDNLALWLAPYATHEGQVWAGTHEAFYAAQQAASQAAGVKWKANALRHSYASYRCAQTGDAGRVAGELGNSAGVVHRHYRELVKPADAERWFAVRPGEADNLIPLPVAASA
jgi:integrase